jgi:hypothetical protein
MPSPQRYLRRDFRYPLHLPVLIRMAQRKDVRARSENISLGGILLSSSFQIPEGSNVEVSVGVDHMQDPGILLNARGRVLRVQPKETGDFAVAIKLEGAFKLPLSSGSAQKPKEKKLPESRTKSIMPIMLPSNLVPAWFTET